MVVSSFVVVSMAEMVLFAPMGLGSMVVVALPPPKHPANTKTMESLIPAAVSGLQVLRVST